MDQRAEESNINQHNDIDEDDDKDAEFQQRFHLDGGQRQIQFHPSENHVFD